jgi:hypothetical protein
VNGYRLETFAPAGQGPGRPRRNPLEERIEAVREEAWHAGFLEGQTMATEAHLDDQTRLTSAFIEALADARVTNEAARHHVVESVAPMIEALVHAPAARPRLRLAPELCDRIEAALRERGLATTLEEAPELLPREVQVFWDQGYDHLDLDACIAQVRACIASHLRPKATDDDRGS